MENEMSLQEFFWRCSQQILLYSPEPSGEYLTIEGWGSGFALRYKDSTYFITCDHNIHLLDDYENGERCDVEFRVGIVTNYRKPQSIFAEPIPIGGFWFFDKYDLKFPELVDLQDIAIAEFPSTIPFPLTTRALRNYNGEIAVCENLDKLIIGSELISSPKENTDYVVTGCVCNSLKDDIRMDATSVFIEGIKYTGRKYQNTYDVFETPAIAYKDNWQGLSGSPIFDENGFLVGMVNQIVDGSRELYVTPITSILKYIDMIIQQH